MMDFSQMFTRLAIALALGALMGLERQLVGKEAGVRTSMLVAGGSAIFSMVGLTLPYIIAGPFGAVASIPEILARNSGFLAVIANIVVGIGFIGAGLIIKTEERVHGLTTAAVIWVVAGIGMLAGIGLTKFATAAALLVSGLLYLVRKIGILERIGPRSID